MTVNNNNTANVSRHLINRKLAIIFISFVLVLFISKKEENINWNVSPVFSSCHIYLTVSCFVCPVYLYSFCDEENKLN